MAKQLKITLVRGLVGTTARQKGSVQTLGLKKIRSSVVREDSHALRGVLRAIGHLVTVEEVSS